MRRAAKLARAGALAAAAGLGAAFAAMDAAWGQAPAAPNYSSHGASFFEGLLAGRVWVLERPNSSRAGDRGTVWAHYHAPDGGLLACAHLGGAYRASPARWRVVPSRAFRALYNYNEVGTGPDPAQRRGHAPLFYDPDTGRLHNEALSGGRWAVASTGWVQESWPRAMKEACPELSLPAGLRVNGKQTATAFGTMMAQDPAAPLRNAPGSHLRGHGATGIAAADGRPTLSAPALARFLNENDGFVLEDTAGARHVLVLGAAGDELWLLAGDGAVADVGLLVPAAGGTEIAVHYERLPIRPRYRIGEALPFLPTGERFAAMRLTDRLAESGAPVALAFPGRPDTAVRFNVDGTLRAGDGGGTVAGSWRWSRGELVVRLEGGEAEGRWPWRVLAGRSGLTVP